MGRPQFAWAHWRIWSGIAATREEVESNNDFYWRGWKRSYRGRESALYFLGKYNGVGEELVVQPAFSKMN